MTWPNEANNIFHMIVPIERAYYSRYYCRRGVYYSAGRTTRGGALTEKIRHIMLWLSLSENRSSFGDLKAFSMPLRIR